MFSRRRVNDIVLCSAHTPCPHLSDRRSLRRNTNRAPRFVDHQKHAASFLRHRRTGTARPPLHPQSDKSAADCSAQTRSPSSPILRSAIRARSTAPNALRHLSNDRGLCQALSTVGRYSTAAGASAATPQKSSSDFPARTLNRLRLCFRRETAHGSTSSRHPLNKKRRAPHSAHTHVPAPRQKLFPGLSDRSGSAQSAANPPTRYAPKSSRRLWTCTSHSRRKCPSACPPRPSPRRRPADSKAPPQSPQSKQSPGNQISASR